VFDIARKPLETEVFVFLVSGIIELVAGQVKSSKRRKVMSKELENDITEEQAKLRNQLELLAERVNKDIYEQRSHLLGKVLTIVDSAFTDPEQRKAVKDLVNNAWYQGSYWNYIGDQFHAIADANGVELGSGLANQPEALEPGKDYSYHQL